MLLAVDVKADVSEIDYQIMPIPRGDGVSITGTHDINVDDLDLEAQDDGPDEAEDQPRVAVHDVLGTDTLQTHLQARCQMSSQMSGQTSGPMSDIRLLQSQTRPEQMIR